MKSRDSFMLKKLFFYQPSKDNILQYLMKFNQFLWNFYKYYEILLILWNFKKFYEILWHCMTSYDIIWHCMKFYDS